MIVAILVFALVGCMGLFVALRPEVYSRYFLAKYQRKALSGKFKALSFTGWLIFGVCLAVVLAIPFLSHWRDFAPIASPIFFLLCAGAYAWWGVSLVRKPGSFLERAAAPWNRLPVRGVQSIGVLLLLGACGFLYGFIRTTTALLR
jgi:hypothetical protein